MKNYFVINPAAGQGKGLSKLKKDIKNAAEKLAVDVEIYETKKVLDGEHFVFKTAINDARNGEDQLRFFACGGDGTLNEVTNGAKKALEALSFEAKSEDNSSSTKINIGCVPIGTGNDTVRTMIHMREDSNEDMLDEHGCNKFFTNIEAQLKGSPVKVDLIKYSGIIDGSYRDKYCINMLNIGFDSNAAAKVGKFKKIPMVKGYFAYILAIFSTLVRKKTMGMEILSDGEPLANGDYLLCAISNGRYCGGGILSSPKSEVQDGYFDVNLISNMSRREFVKLFPLYQEGTHIDSPETKDILETFKCKNLVVKPFDKDFYLCIDGEISVAEEVTFNMEPEAIGFIIPKE